MCFGASLAVSPNAAAEPYDFVSTVGHLPMAMFGPVMEESNGKLYVIGGLPSDLSGMEDSLSTVWIYDTQTRETTQGRSMQYGTSLAVSSKGVDGRIYVFGGWNWTFGGYMYTTQIYNPASNTWSNGSNAPEPIGGGDAVTLSDGRILLFGAAIYHYNSTLIYNPTTDKWSYASDQPSSIWLRRAVLWNSTAVIVMGGRLSGTATNNVLVYNPVTGGWNTGAPMVSAEHSGGAAIAANGYVYYVGGSSGGWPDTGVLSSALQRYDPDTNAWELSRSTLPMGLAGFGCAADAYGRIFIAAGYDGSSTVSTILMVNPSDIVWDTMMITSPADGSVVSGEVIVTVQIQNMWYGVTTVDLYVDGELLGSNYAGWSSATSFSWDTGGLADGSAHVILARGFMPTGRVLEDSVTVTVWAQSLAEHVAAAEQAIAALQADVDSLQADLAALDAQLTAFEASVDADLTALQASSDAIAAQIALLESQLALVKGDLATLTANVTAGDNALSSQLNALNTRVTDLETLLSGLNTALAETQDMIGELEDAVAQNNQTTQDTLDTKMSSTMGYVNLALIVVVLVVVLAALLMGRKKP